MFHVMMESKTSSSTNYQFSIEQCSPQTLKIIVIRRCILCTRRRVLLVLVI